MKYLIILTIVFILLFSPKLVIAEVNHHASCMGHEAEAISSPGSLEEFPGGAPQLKKFIDSLGVTPGAVYKTIAQLHEGSHEACDEALE